MLEMTTGRSDGYGNGLWAPLAPPADPLADTYRYRAQSVLYGLVDDRDGRPYTYSAFTAEEAEEILRWAAKTPVQ